MSGSASNSGSSSAFTSSFTHTRTAEPSAKYKERAPIRESQGCYATEAWWHHTGCPFCTQLRIANTTGQNNAAAKACACSGAEARGSTTFHFTLDRPVNNEPATRLPGRPGSQLSACEAARLLRRCVPLSNIWTMLKVALPAPAASSANLLSPFFATISATVSTAPRGR